MAGEEEAGIASLGFETGVERRFARDEDVAFGGGSGNVQSVVLATDSTPGVTCDPGASGLPRCRKNDGCGTTSLYPSAGFAVSIVATAVRVVEGDLHACFVEWSERTQGNTAEVAGANTCSSDSWSRGTPSPATRPVCTALTFT